jgi:DNA-directed RNA polymerase subunit delta
MNFLKKKQVQILVKRHQKKKKKGASSKKTSKTVNDDDDVVVEIEDDWEKSDEDEDYDPDFEEFNIPKSKIKKPSAKKRKDDENLDLDKYLKGFDLFNDGTDTDDDEDDF